MTDNLPEPTRGRPKSVSPRVRVAIESLAVGETKTISAAARAAGISREALSKALQKAHVDEYRIKRIRAARRVGALRASAKMSELVDSKNGIVSLRACEYELGVGAGLVKPAEHRNAVSVNIAADVRAGFVIKLMVPQQASASEPAKVLDIKANAVDDDYPIVP